MPRNKYPEETVQTILDAAFKLFTEKGYENTTVLDIVDQMGGLTRGAFYHHFKSKEEVMSALTEHMFYKDNPFEKVKGEEALTGLEKLRQIMKNSLVDSDSRRISIQAIPLLKNPKFLAELVESNRDMIVPAYHELIEEGIADGSVHTSYPKQAAEILSFLTNFWLAPTIFPFDREEGIARVRMIRKVTDDMGIPIFDDEIMYLIEAMLKELE